MKRAVKIYFARRRLAKAMRAVNNYAAMSNKNWTFGVGLVLQKEVSRAENRLILALYG